MAYAFESDVHCLIMPTAVDTMLGNGVVGILSESSNKWERRVPLAPAHCARLLHGGRQKTGISRIIIQPSTKRIYHDAQYEDVGCEISDDLSECGLILGIKHPKVRKVICNYLCLFCLLILKTLIINSVFFFFFFFAAGDDSSR